MSQPQMAFSNVPGCKCEIGAGTYSGMPTHYVIRPELANPGLPTCFLSHWDHASTANPFINCYSAQWNAPVSVKVP